MNKKYLYGIAGIALLGSIIAFPMVVSAQTEDTGTATFIQKLATKLGIDQSRVETALSETRDEMKSEMEAKRTAEINQAVADGKLTQRQADILNALSEFRGNVIKNIEPAQIKEDFENMTEEERRAEMVQMRTQMQQELVNSLNENGLNTTLEELNAAQEAARDAGLFPAKFGRGPKFVMGL